MLNAIMSYGIYTAALRSKPQMHWTSLIFSLCLGATLASLPMLAFEAAQGQTIFPDPRGWAVIASVVIFPSLIRPVFYLRAVALIGASRAGLFINLLPVRSEEHTSELQFLMRISYAVFCVNKNTIVDRHNTIGQDIG